MVIIVNTVENVIINLRMEIRYLLKEQQPEQRKDNNRRPPMGLIPLEQAVYL